MFQFTPSNAYALSTSQNARTVEHVQSTIVEDVVRARRFVLLITLWRYVYKTYRRMYTTSYAILILWNFSTGLSIHRRVLAIWLDDFALARVAVRRRQHTHIRVKLPSSLAVQWIHCRLSRWTTCLHPQSEVNHMTMLCMRCMRTTIQVRVWFSFDGLLLTNRCRHRWQTCVGCCQSIYLHPLLLLRQMCCPSVGALVWPQHAVRSLYGTIDTYNFSVALCTFTTAHKRMNRDRILTLPWSNLLRVLICYYVDHGMELLLWLNLVLVLALDILTSILTTFRTLETTLHTSLSAVLSLRHY